MAASSVYHVRGVEYDLGSREPEGVSARRDAATLQPKEFARLYEGLGESGQSLITKAALFEDMVFERLQQLGRQGVKLNIGRQKS